MMRDSQSNYGQPSRTVIPLTGSRAFTARNCREPNFPFYWHYHPEWEIVFSHSGFGTRHVGTSVEQFGHGDLVMIPANVPHTWFSSSEQKEETYCSVIQFLPDSWGNDFWHLQELREFHQLRNKAQRGIRFDGPGLGEVGRLMEELAGHDVPSIRSLCALLEIFGRLSELEIHSLHAVDEGRSSWRNPRLDDLLAWIEERLGELTQKDAAARVKMTPTAFSRWFKINMGCQFQRYVNEIRVARVCSEIALGKLSITEAAFQVGYNNLSNFNRRFVEITGLTPQAFRKQIQGGPVVGRVLGRKGGTAPARPVRVNWSAPLNPALPEDRIDPKWIGDPP